MSTQWVPVLGAFDFEGDDVVFQGRLIELPAGADTKKQAMVGRALSNRIFNGGTIGVDVTLTPPEKEIADQGYPLVAELQVFGDPNSGTLVTAGIGGDFFLYSARVWSDKDQRWLGSVIKGGYIGQLNLGIPHRISVEV